jgi:hypothetical protein
MPVRKKRDKIKRWGRIWISTGTEAARGAEGAPAPPTACVIKEFFFSFP